MPGLTIQPGSISGLGAVAETANLDSLSDDDFQTLREALYRYNVVCVKGQKTFTAHAQADLTRRFDPSATSYGHGKTIDAKRSILHPDLKTVPAHPEVQIIGNGSISEYEGLRDFKLKHPHHRTFHRSVIADELDLDYTRFYRWHIDAALFGELNPPLVTSLFAAKVPSGRTQTLVYDDGSDQSLQVPLGTTAFVSGYTMFDLLSPEQKEFALGTKVEYAPHPYVWISTAKSRPNGLGMVSEGLETPVADLPAFKDSDIQILPMVWQNPVTGQLALQIHPSPVMKLHCADGRVLDDLEEVRRVVYELQRAGIAPEHVYAHDWEEGDLVLFNNHGVLHSVVGAFAEDEVRLFRQCNLAASKPPKGPQQ
jgi:xanthine dioxygenase